MVLSPTPLSQSPNAPCSGSDSLPQITFIWKLSFCQKHFIAAILFWSMTQIGHLYYQMPADFHLYGPSKCLITLRKDDAKTETATGLLNHFIGLRHLSVWWVFLAKAEKCRANINAATGCCQHPLRAEHHTGTCTPHPHKAVSELIFKHFTVLYIEDFQQKIFYDVVERSFTKWHGYSGIIMDCTALCTKQPWDQGP